MKKLTNYIIICVALTSCVQKVDLLEYSCTSTLTTVNGNTCTGNDTIIYKPNVVHHEVFSDDEEGIKELDRECSDIDWSETRFPTGGNCFAILRSKTDRILTKLN